MILKNYPKLAKLIEFTFMKTHQTEKKIKEDMPNTIQQLANTTSLSTQLIEEILMLQQKPKTAEIFRCTNYNTRFKDLEGITF